MSIRDDYFRRLDHLGEPVTLLEMHRDRRSKDLVALRHDVDHNLDLALELAYHEGQRGVRSSYFLLHTAPYWSDPDLELKLRQLGEYGHEVGLHLNVISEWLAGETDDVGARVAELLGVLRGAGLRVVGTSAHGDRACYEHGFINYWIWSELRGEDPFAEEHGLSAEGIRVEDPDWQIAYPGSESLLRSDGAKFPLWSVSMASAGLDYDASHLVFDRYWTDSGGAWKRSGDPLESDLSRGRHQVLMHPIWWRDEQRVFFVASSARSGSQWLANFADRATSCVGLHEWALHHRRENGSFVRDKRTRDDWVGLMEEPDAARGLLRDAKVFYAKHTTDVLETNVYLESFMDLLREEFETSQFIHLHRDGRDVVTSILNRGWFDSPADRHHREAPVEEWPGLNQFERACWYWRIANEAISHQTDRRLVFEQMVGDLDGLTKFFTELGVVVHPLLAKAAFGEHLNANPAGGFPKHEAWSEAQRATYARICGDLHRRLGYADVGEAAAAAIAVQPVDAFDPRQARLRLWLQALTPVGVRLRRSLRGFRLRARGDRVDSGYLLVGRGRWDRLTRGSGWALGPDQYVEGQIGFELPERARLRLFALFYAADGRLVTPRPVATLRDDRSAARFGFAAPHDASRFALAIKLDRLPEGRSARIFEIALCVQPLPEGYLAASALAPEAEVGRC